jgi:hypothetical protein
LVNLNKLLTVAAAEQVGKARVVCQWPLQDEEAHRPIRAAAAQERDL